MLFMITNTIFNMFFAGIRKVEINWLSDRTQVITMRIFNRDAVHLER